MKGQSEKALGFVLLGLFWSALALGGAPAAATGGRPAPAVAGVQAGWLPEAEKRIAENEYEVTWQTRTALQGSLPSWQAPNRAHNFRTYFTPDALQVMPRTGDATWTLTMKLARWGRQDHAQTAQPSASLNAEGKRIAYTRGEIIETYENSRQGLEQIFHIAVRPRGAYGAMKRPVNLDLAIGGGLLPQIAGNGQAVDFAFTGGVKVLHYAGLRVTDANGRLLRSWMEGFSEGGLRGIRLIYDDTDAVYPVTIDPLLTYPSWSVESNQAEAMFGCSVATAGDVNGDGYSDVIIGARQYDNGQTNEGRAYVYHGSSSGLSTTPAVVLEINQANAEFGVSVAPAGDVNGDGYSDVIIGAPYYSNGQSLEGRAYVYLGSSTGITSTGPWTAESNQAGAYFGFSVAGAGDVNNDGYSDVIVGAYSYNHDQTDEGSVFAWYGSSTGLGSSGTPSNADWTVESNQVLSYFGYSISTAGDVNGDGYADVIVGALLYDGSGTDNGRAYIYPGSSTGLSTTALWTKDGDQDECGYGRSVATAGDVNGDGYSDIIVGALFYDNGEEDEGRAYVYEGSYSGPSSTPAWTGESDVAGALYSISVGPAGDVNGDGYGDVVIGASNLDDDVTEQGRVYVYRGSADGLSTVPYWTSEGSQAGEHYGFSAATAGDVNGDGFADLVVGSWMYDNGQTNEGAAYVFLGSSGGLETESHWEQEGAQALAFFASSVAMCDVNGDGYSDVFIGAQFYDNGQTDEGKAFGYYGSATGPSGTADWTVESNQADANLGRSMACAGDVNGDGYSDLIVGADRETNGQSHEGVVRVYYGTGGGLSTSAAWTAESNQTGSEFGWSVAGAGDVNGDGYADIIVGAHGYSNDQRYEGRVFGWYGGSGGLGSPGTPSNADWIVESNQAGDPKNDNMVFFGYTVAGAGDVNRDGFSDVLVGAVRYDHGEQDEGRIYLYYGSKDGLATTESWTWEPNQEFATVGRGVASAGDVNGDGYSDIIAGGYFYDDGEEDEGGAFVFYGSDTVPSSSPDWTTEGNQYDAEYGAAVSSAGDVNGDGYSDVIVGAPHYSDGKTAGGAAFVYLGSSTGLSTTPSWIAYGDQDGADFGYFFDHGDVNGDGYSDVLVSAWVYDVDGMTDAGEAVLYYGGEGRGVSLRPRPRATTDTGPAIPLWGRSNATSSFRVNLLGRSPFGTAKVQLEAEAREPKDPFATPAGVTSAADSGVDGVTQSFQFTGLDTNTLYAWRARVRYNLANSIFTQYSRWLTQPWGGVQEPKLRTHY